MANPIQHPRAGSSSTGNSKRHRQDHRHHRKHNPQQQEQPLIPGLPDHVAQLCLSLVQPSLLYSVCHSWRRLIYSPSFPPYLSLYTLLLSTTGDDHSIQFFSFDPISSTWEPLPPPPLQDPPLRLLIRHPSFISRHLPIQSVSACGPLILLAATTHNFLPALPRPLVFNPLSRTWALGPPLSSPRRWCAAGSTRGAVYVASGIGSHFTSDVAKSAERWDRRQHLQGWEKVRALKDGRFSGDAIDAVGWRGKLCLVNRAREGVVYDAEKDVWEEMPKGMAAGWKGPVAAMDEEVMFVVDEAKGAVRRYDPNSDQWEEVMESERLIGAQRIAAAAGRLCVVCGGRIVVVDVRGLPVREWPLQTPPGFEAVAIHILPRMSRPDIGSIK